ASLREALNRLGLMGLVESRHGSGTFVRTARPHDLMNSLSALLILDKATAGELLEARFYVESALAQIAAVNRTDADIKRLNQLMQRMEREHYALGIDSFVPLDTQWHLAIAQASRNQVLGKVLEVIWSVLPERIRHISSGEQIPQYLAFHRAVYTALVNRDQEAARREAERHVAFLIKLNEHAEAPASAPGS
ncbi:MAG: FadR/GntR family transcriptional regulator, partial [Chloroflexota bacterium]